MRLLTYDYDANGQLISTKDVPTTGGVAGSSTTTTSSYDPNGNSAAAAATSGHLGPNNELLDDGTFSYSYDAEGSRSAKLGIDIDIFDHNLPVKVLPIGGTTEGHWLVMVTYPDESFGCIAVRTNRRETYFVAAGIVEFFELLVKNVQ